MVDSWYSPDNTKLNLSRVNSNENNVVRRNENYLVGFLKRLTILLNKSTLNINFLEEQFINADFNEDEDEISLIDEFCKLEIVPQNEMLSTKEVNTLLFKDGDFESTIEYCIKVLFDFILQKITHTKQSCKINYVTSIAKTINDFLIVYEKRVNKISVNISEMVVSFLKKLLRLIEAADDGEYFLERCGIFPLMSRVIITLSTNPFILDMAAKEVTCKLVKICRLFHLQNTLPLEPVLIYLQILAHILKAYLKYGKTARNSNLDDAMVEVLKRLTIICPDYVRITIDDCRSLI